MPAEIHSMSQLDYGVPATRQATFSTPSVLSLVVALAGWFAASPTWALVLCILSGLLGVIGVIVALMPGIRGGLLSVLSILMGLIGIVIAIIRLIA
jgi:hypothetical protein